MTKWINYKSNKKRQTSVLTQLDNQHKQKVLQNRDFMKVIIECLMYTAQQNIGQRGHEEDLSHLDEVSDVNRANFDGNEPEETNEPEFSTDLLNTTNEQEEATFTDSEQNDSDDGIFMKCKVAVVSILQQDDLHSSSSSELPFTVKPSKIKMRIVLINKSVCVLLRRIFLLFHVSIKLLVVFINVTVN